ncbi:oxygenase MpaB family protein [Mycobacterium talmoniae]|uniref:ER-bound oxygenase mpaB/mpaB'/Rubber oxygenase catalytic domain-containing protein n=1 Tax=Mycobacterium talmoniae TaxID=1858794 RepID=A0A1S1NHK2_9MYCO|nr:MULTISPECIES: oxygenase MpaB family protein [Mycobacterium]OHV05271.1 hypothetical protein BKN37_06320 [Mycobacterium talmoniae]PQM46823.1 hypothetical protein C1Y40_02993 [Mycobacterium talmoniae]TDH52290.1 DUF2236 domain-containing protein [Mycobacterium eburneum]
MTGVHTIRSMASRQALSPVQHGLARGRWKWMRDEIERLDPVADSEQIMRLMISSLLPPFGSRFILELLFTVSLMRVMGQFEGAAAVDRQGRGKVYRNGDRRADDTIRYLTGWVYDGASSPQTQASAADVKRIHDRIGQRYQMSNETFVHTIAFFTVQIECITNIVGAPGFTERERAAQVRHWRAVGEYLGVRAMPDSWSGMQEAMRAYETEPQWFGPSEAAHRVSEKLLEQFGRRTFPPGLRWLARPLVLSLHEDHVLTALMMVKPRPAVVAVNRRMVRAAFWVIRELLPDRREVITS